MIEYQMQMKINGEWTRARIPTGQSYSPYRNPTDRAKVEADIERYRKEWLENWVNNPKVPTDFRVVARTVTEWEPV